MLNTIFTTLFEAQIGDPIWMWIAKGLNVLVWFCAAERLFDFCIRVWNNYLTKKEEMEMEQKTRPIGFR